MSDLISRQAAIDALIKCGDYYNGNNEAKRGVSQCIGVVYDLPSAQECKTGHWIKVGHIEHTYLVSECSVCGYQTIDAGNYCTNCGARMGE